MTKKDDIYYITTVDGEIKPRLFENPDDNIPAEQFLTREQIVQDLATTTGRLPNSARRAIRMTRQTDLISFHMTLGMWIRNNYGLWHHSCPLTTNLAVSANSMKHPDNLSGQIIVELKDLLVKLHDEQD